MPEDTQLEKPLAIIGEEDVVLGFGALGFKVYSVKEPQEFKIALDEAVTQKSVVCLVQDNVYRLLEDRINAYKNLALPVFIPFSQAANGSLLDEIVKGIRLKAIGTF